MVVCYSTFTFRCSLTRTLYFDSLLTFRSYFFCAFFLDRRPPRNVVIATPAFVRQFAITAFFQAITAEFATSTVSLSDVKMVDFGQGIRKV